jgi:hypothetical protein
MFLKDGIVGRCIFWSVFVNRENKNIPSTVGGEEGAQSLDIVDVHKPLEWWISRMQLTTLLKELGTAVRSELAAQRLRFATYDAKS